MVENASEKELEKANAKGSDEDDENVSNEEKEDEKDEKNSTETSNNHTIKLMNMEVFEKESEIDAIKESRDEENVADDEDEEDINEQNVDINYFVNPNDESGRNGVELHENPRTANSKPLTSGMIWRIINFMKTETLSEMLLTAAHTRINGSMGLSNVHHKSPAWLMTSELYATRSQATISIRVRFND